MFKALNLWDTWCTGGPQNCRYNCSQSGWMEAPTFIEWFRNVFIESTKHLEGDKLLIIDGHSSHVTLDSIDLARQNNIHILCLPAHTTHVLQPLDVGVFKTVKLEWKKILKNYLLKYNKATIDKTIFPSLLSELTKTSFKRAHAVAGFESSGNFKLLILF